MLKVENLCKNYEYFSIKNVSFELPKGYITGFIGANGAGKTTTLKSILNLVHPDSGKITIAGKDMGVDEIAIKREIGFMLGPVDYYAKSRIGKTVGVYKRFFPNWDEQAYKNYLDKFSLNENKKICELSAGMKVKLGVALALSQNAKLLILDEPTSGLDPVARDELLDVFREIVESGERSVLFSTHITSDLEKCADFIIFIRNGELILNSAKDDIMESHLLISGRKDALTQSLKERVIGFKETAYNFTALIKTDNIIADDEVIKEKPNLEDIMVYYNKEKSL